MAPGEQTGKLCKSYNDPVKIEKTSIFQKGSHDLKDFIL